MGIVARQSIKGSIVSYFGVFIGFKLSQSEERKYNQAFDKFFEALKYNEENNIDSYYDSLVRKELDKYDK